MGQCDHIFLVSSDFVLCFLIAPFLPRDRDSITRDVLLFACGISLWFLFPHVNQHGYLSILNIGGALHNVVFFLTGFLMCKYDSSSGRYSGSLALAAFACSVFLYVPAVNYIDRPHCLT